MPGDAYATLERGAIASAAGRRAQALALLERAAATRTRVTRSRGRRWTLARAGRRVDVEELNRSILAQSSATRLSGTEIALIAAGSRLFTLDIERRIFASLCEDAWLIRWIPDAGSGPDIGAASGDDGDTAWRVDRVALLKPMQKPKAGKHDNAIAQLIILTSSLTLARGPRRGAGGCALAGSLLSGYGGPGRAARRSSARRC